ncbi:MAG: tetratricopeptide repeat protein [Planctomycetota bacterium]
MRELQGKNVAITGRLAALTREEAARSIRECGGEYVTSVDERTAIVVVGRDGFPVGADGRLGRNLRAARQLAAKGIDIEIIAEEVFLHRVGLGEKEEAIHQLYSTAQLSRILQVAESKIRAWVRRGVITPARQEKQVSYFDFRQVSMAKVVTDLDRSGVPVSRIQRSLEQLEGWLPGITAAVAPSMQLLQREGQLLVRLDDGHLADTRGQLQFDFGSTARPEANAAPSTSTPSAAKSNPKVERKAEDWFREGIEHEERERWEAAAGAYENALAAGEPTPEIRYNLGNVRCQLGDYDAAITHFREAVRLDPSLVEAWSNLGIALSELGQWDESVAAFRHALRIAPLYADAHYNLAETLAQQGKVGEAERHWQAYLDQDPHSAWAREVRKRLREARRPSR